MTNAAESFYLACWPFYGSDYSYAHRLDGTVRINFWHRDAWRLHMTKETAGILNDVCQSYGVIEA